MELPYFNPYTIKVVEEIQTSTQAERTPWLQENHFNLFFLDSSQIMMDMMTDSGTGGLSAQQWAAMMTADESYAGSLSFSRLQKTIQRLTGFKYVIPAHQGRATENVLMPALIKKGSVVPGNRQFFTTDIHIQRNGGKCIDCTIDEAQNIKSDYPFKGNVNLEKLEQIYKQHKHNIPCCLLTITCNSVGGQAVSLENIKAVHQLSQEYEIPVIYDAARFAQNAYFIKTREEAYKEKSIKEIVKDIFDHSEGMFMSAKKDGLVNMGGFIALRDQHLFQKTSVNAVLFEGFTTYGGMSGMNMNALAQGLEEATSYSYLKSRIHQVEYLSQKLLSYGIPLLRPDAGHAVFLDALKILPHVPREESPSHTLAVELYKEGGIRAGNGELFSGSKNKETGEIDYPENELLRLTVPQREFTQNHLDYAAAVIKNVYERRDQITKGYNIIYEPEAPVMKMFMVQLQKA